MSPADKAEASINFQKIEVTSDGTRQGTIVRLNGKPIKDLAVLRLIFWNDEYAPNAALEFG